MMQTTKPESWDKFLEDIANDFALKGKYRDVFFSQITKPRKLQKADDIYL